ncbi:hypothetical protein N7510_002745 [Penicillium lagena]|uniref:uncharacterized protein n=1 Tax=Penicillium lagena TaxID=94218 RepID=UPI0025401E99|nr:uncharacterized protein N7510_002745 [Penicillium lagena]KAJ5618761.1 hypothetical protein N7510_002745 [Penicillium lagena]
MTSHHSNFGLSSLPAGRTGHACVQCRHRKQKCGGFTYGIKCRPCATRKVKCSFQEEVKDPRYNPYLLIGSSRSSSIGVDSGPTDSIPISSTSASLFPTLPAFDAGDVHSPVWAVPVEGPEVPATNDELPKQLELLTSRITKLERQFVTSQRDSTDFLNLFFSLGAFSNSETPSLSSPQGAVNTEGPLKALNSFQTDDPVEFEMHDPVARSILSKGEGCVVFRLYFTHCHPIAPFLDVGRDMDIDRVRSSSILLFLSILCVGARFWSASSKTLCWLHPRYTELVRLLDAEIMRITLRPRHDDQKVETVQALMLCAHWMPFDVSADKERYLSRFSEGGAWQCLGLAIRWATSLALERTSHISFQRPGTATEEDARRFRTMLYLVESDHYLALSARRPSYLNPEPFHNVLANFLGCKYAQPTDIRLTSLFRVAYGAHFTGCRPTTIESVEAFDADVQIIERHFLSSVGDGSTDSFSLHFPFTSLRWYRLSYTCAFLDATDPTQRTGKALTWAIELASQILIHLSCPVLSTRVNYTVIPAQLEPDPSVVKIMSCAIDHYIVVVAYAAFFLVNSWLSNLVDLNLRPHSQERDEAVDDDTSRSLLFRLVDVAARTLEAASPSEGHLARRYVPLLRGMTGLLLSGNTQAQKMSSNSSNMMMNASNLPQEQMQNQLGGDLWDMWQQAGLGPMIWPNLADDLYEG